MFLFFLKYNLIDKTFSSCNTHYPWNHCRFIAWFCWQITSIVDNVALYSLMSYVLGVFEAANNGSLNCFIPALALPSTEYAWLQADETKVCWDFLFKKKKNFFFVLKTVYWLIKLLQVKNMTDCYLKCTVYLIL